MLPRWLKSIAAVLSALICLIALACWALSYLPPHLHIISHQGCLLFISVEGGDDRLKQYTDSRALLILMSGYGNVYQHSLGFAHVSGTGALDRFQIIAIPYWFIVLLSAVGPILLWRTGRLQRLRKIGGRCPRCGYDLRATPDQCPECGWKAHPVREPSGSAAGTKQAN